MLTPECRSRDFSVRTRRDSTKNSLCHFESALGRQNMPECARNSTQSRDKKRFYINDLVVAGAPGFEPGITRPKPVALPLGHAPSRFFGSRPLARRANRLDQWPRWRAARFAVLPASGPLGNGSACAASKNFAQDPPARCCGPARPRLYTVLFQPKSLVEAECSAAW